MPRSKQAVQEERAEVVSAPSTVPEVLDKIMETDWVVGYCDQGMGHGNYAVLIAGTGEVVVKCPSREVAEHIVTSHKFSQLHYDDVHCDVMVDYPGPKGDT